MDFYDFPFRKGNFIAPTDEPWCWDIYLENGWFWTMANVGNFFQHHGAFGILAHVSISIFCPLEIISSPTCFNIQPLQPVQPLNPSASARTCTTPPATPSFSRSVCARCRRPRCESMAAIQWHGDGDGGGKMLGKTHGKSGKKHGLWWENHGLWLMGKPWNMRGKPWIMMGKRKYGKTTQIEWMILDDHGLSSFSSIFVAVILAYATPSFPVLGSLPTPRRCGIGMAQTPWSCRVTSTPSKWIPTSQPMRRRDGLRRIPEESVCRGMKSMWGSFPGPMKQIWVSYEKTTTSGFAKEKLEETKPKIPWSIMEWSAKMWEIPWMFAKCGKYHAKCKVTMPKCSKYNTMQNDWF